MLNIRVMSRMLLIVWLLTISLEALAEVIGEFGFVYKGGAISFLTADEGDATGKFVAAWNPKASDRGGQLLKPGLKIAFWGLGVGCKTFVSTGPVTGNAEWLFGQAEEKTGVPIDQKHLDHRWAPTGGGEFCSADSRQRAGPSFVHVNENSDRGGIGIFSSSGGGTGKEFFSPIGDNGQNNTGVNQNIQGTFVIFRFDPKGANAIFPFGKDQSLANGKAVVIDSTQNLASFKVAPSPDSYSRSPNQVKQQVAMTFLNVDCMANRNPKSLCQIKYLLHTAVFREGVTDWSKELWFDKASLLLDPAQGGLPVLHGPIKAAGISTVSKDNPRLSIWKSLGSETLHAKFDPTRFVVEISYDQFRSALMLATARMSASSSFSVGKEDMVRFFGKTWDVPASWRLLDVSVAQEVHNKNSDAASWIGGGVASLSVTSHEP